MDNLCKICGINPAPKSNYYGMCAPCRTQKYSFTKGNKCLECGVVVSNRAKRCKEHQSVHRHHRITITCEVCGRQKTVKYSNVHGKNQKTRGGLYCSRKCKQQVFENAARQRGTAAQAFKIGPTIHIDGYVDVWDEGRGRRIHEHTQKAEKVLGRRLKRGEVVHHINMVRSDNRNCNLLICDQTYHMWLHHQMALAWVKSHPELLKSS